MKKTILLVCRLADHTLRENVLLPLLESGEVAHIHVLRDTPADTMDGRVSYLCPERESRSVLRHIGKVRRGVAAVRRCGADAIIGVLNTPHGYIGRLIAWLTGKPYIHMTIAGHREFWVDGKCLEKLNLWALGSSAALTVTGSRTKAYLTGHGIAPEKLFILPNLPDEAFARVTGNGGPRQYDIVSFSRIDRNKNLILLVEALARIKGKYAPRVAVAGDGDCLPAVRAAARERGVEGMMDFLGYVSGFENKVKLLTDSRIFVSCSKGEGFPVSLLEAMSCGCVPVTSDVGDIVDIVHHGENGLVFTDTDDAGELASCLETLLSDEDRRLAMQAAGSSLKGTFSAAANGQIWSRVLRYATKG
ncbi:MAG: glycosyltransferase family 4 protein [Bacteroidales bacterium]|nr:glycosyltransferase family 4 protein [Bacteroidales bacterium]